MTMRAAATLVSWVLVLNVVTSQDCPPDGHLDDWMVVMRSSVGTGTSLYALWTSADSLNGENCTLWSPNKEVTGAMKSSLVDSDWDSVEQVRVSLYTNGVQSMFIDFNATGTNKISWFAAENVIDSSYTDITTLPHLYFSIEGVDIANAIRRFYVANIHQGCAGDRTWLMVLDDAARRACDWEQGHPAPSFRYSASSTVALGADNRMADVFMVSVKFSDTTEAAGNMGGCLPDRRDYAQDISI